MKKIIYLLLLSLWGVTTTGFAADAVATQAQNIQEIRLITLLVTAIALILTIVSLVDYIVKNKNVMKEDVK